MRAEAWRAELSPEDGKHVDDAWTPEAGGFLNALPVKWAGVVMAPGHFRRAVAHRLVGADALSESERAGTGCPRCGDTASDPQGRHAVGCGDAWGGRHKAVRDVLLHALLRAGVADVEWEKGLEHIAARTRASAASLAQALIKYANDTRNDNAEGARPADLLLRWPSRVGAAVLTAFDVTVHSPHSIEAQREAEVGAAPAVVLGENQKFKAAAALALVGAECYPLAMSTNGRMSERSAAFVKELAKRLSHKREDVGVVDQTRWLMQRVSVAIAEANGKLLEEIAKIMDEQ
jgi:hypothetical protein